VIAGGVRVSKCNYGIYQFNQRMGRWRANEKVLTREECLWIRRVVCPSCGNYQRCLGEELKGGFLGEEKAFKDWFSHQNLFDLREERMSL
jgi:hypothetical protein